MNDFGPDLFDSDSEDLWSPLTGWGQDEGEPDKKDWPWTGELLGGEADGETFEMDGNPPLYVRIKTKQNRPQFFSEGETLPDCGPPKTHQVYARSHKNSDNVLIYKWIREEHDV